MQHCNAFKVAQIHFKTFSTGSENFDFDSCHCGRTLPEVTKQYLKWQHFPSYFI